jgi:hypothetical protein
MPTVNTKDLTGHALDWAVARAIGLRPSLFIFTKTKALDPEHWYSTDWARGGPLTSRARISIHYCRDLRDSSESAKYVHAETPVHVHHWYSRGWDNPLVAAMRCLVASELGVSVDVPEALKHAKSLA